MIISRVGVLVGVQVSLANTRGGVLMGCCSCYLSVCLLLLFYIFAFEPTFLTKLTHKHFKKIPAVAFQVEAWVDVCEMFL